MIWADRIGLVLLAIVLLAALFLHPVSYPAPPAGEYDPVLWKLVAYFALIPWFLMRCVHFILTARFRSKRLYERHKL
jgi:hypothetical protein